MKAFTFILILFWSVANGQHKFEAVNREEVKKLTTNASLPTYYSRLLTRFNAFDTTLTSTDYRLLYYGFEFQKGYNTNTNHHKKEILQLINDKKYPEAIKFCDSVLQQIPISLTANYMEALALNDMDAGESKILKYRNRYRKLRNAILHSGNGFKCETGFQFIYTADMDEIMFRYFEVAGNPTANNESPACISYTINPTKYFNASKIYFVKL